MCILCSGRGFVLAAPVEDGDTLGHPNVRNSYVGTWHEVPCWLCFDHSNLKVLNP